MDSSSSSKKRKFHEENEVVDSQSSSSPLTLVSMKKTKCWTHDVFPSFRGEDVRRNFLSHIQKECKRKGITLFVDNNIKRGESIAPELIHAISSSKIAVVLISKNYASSKWCLDELVEIMKCKKELGQTVFVVFYEVDPSHVKKLTGDFGAVFKKTCEGKTEEDIMRWREAFAEVATIAGYDSRNWDNEAVMIEEIVAEISRRLIGFAPSRELEGLVGMERHMKNMKPLICLESDEARMIGIWGPPGIGKTTIARVILHLYSSSFQVSAFIEFKPGYEKPTSSDDYTVKLHYEQQLISKLTSQEDFKISRLGATEDFLFDKKALIVLDGVNQLIQLLAISKAECLGSGTRIIITTQDQRLLNAIDVKHIYEVDFPPSEEALEIFCINAFGQNSPKDGFSYLAAEVTRLVGELPLGLKVMGCHFRGMPKQDWEGELLRLMAHLDGEIESILKFSYDALGSEDKDLFLLIACLFEGYIDETFEDVVGHKFSNVQQGIKVLIQRSLISIFDGLWNQMHSLLVQLGEEIVRNQKPGKRKYLVDVEEIIEVLNYNTGSKSIIGINLDYSMLDEDLNISESAFEKISNLEFLRVYDKDKRLVSEQGLKYLPPKLRLLEWDNCPMRCFPSQFNPKFLVQIIMKNSNLEKLWDGIQPLQNLKLMTLTASKNLRELPDLSTAINLLDLDLGECSSLVELPSSIGNAIKLKELYLYDCKSLVELPSSIGNLVHLEKLHLQRCCSLLKLPSSIGNATNLQDLDLNGCSSLVELSSSIGNLTNLQELNLNGCSSLVKIPSSVGNLINLQKFKLEGCSSLVEFPSSIGNAFNLQELKLNGCSSLVEIPSSIGNLGSLTELSLRGCSKLKVLPININLESLEVLDLGGCSQLISFPEISTNIRRLVLTETSIKQVPLSINSWSQLRELRISYLENIGEFPHLLDIIKTLLFHGITEMQEFPPWFNGLPRLLTLLLIDCKKLVSLPQLPGSLSSLYVVNCESLEKVACCSFPKSLVYIIFVNCWKLKEKARDIIIQASRRHLVVLPGREVPAFITNRAIKGGSVTVKLSQRCFPTLLRFKVCIILVNKSGNGVPDAKNFIDLYTTIVDKQSGRDYTPRPLSISPLLEEHMYIYEVEARDVESSELLFEFRAESDKWEIAECGVQDSSESEERETDSSESEERKTYGFLLQNPLYASPF